jgi:hypothetical protein
MLNLKLNENVSPTIKELLTQWRRVHVSRFPVDAVSHDHNVDSVKFVDSRFPTDTWRKDRILGYLTIDGRDDKGRLIYKLHSRLITNEKYNAQNDDYHIKKTNDPKKMLSLLKEYVKPYSPQEIAHRFNDGIHGNYDEWRDQPKYEYQEMARSLNIVDIVEEVAYLHSVGVQFRSPAFKKLATQGAESLQEYNRRKSLKQENLHVFIQPDDSVMVTRPNGTSHVYENMERVPEVIQQQVAMLRMMDGVTYLPEVGKRSLDQRMFWVHVNPDVFNLSNT